MPSGGGLRFLLIGVVIGFVLGQGYTPTDVIAGAGTLWRIITGKEGKKNTSPTAYVIYPRDEAIFRIEDEIALEGMGIDAEDGELEGNALIWMSDEGKQLRSGRNVTLPIDENLSPGWRTITLTAKDRAGGEGTATISIYVVQRKPKP